MRRKKKGKGMLVEKEGKMQFQQESENANDKRTTERYKNKQWDIKTTADRVLRQTEADCKASPRVFIMAQQEKSACFRLL